MRIEDEGARYSVTERGDELVTKHVTERNEDKDKGYSATEGRDDVTQNPSQGMRFAIS